MPIASSDIVYRLTVKTGSAGDSTAGTPAGSLGKYASTTVVTDATLNNLFDDISGDENAASDVEYRAVAVLNNHSSLTLTAPVVWISSEVAGGASVAISVDTTAASAKGAAGAQLKEVADESTAPSSQTFTAPTTKGTGLAMSDIAAGQVKGLWIRRTAANSAALNNDGATIRVEGDTAA